MSAEYPKLVLPRRVYLRPPSDPRVGGHHPSGVPLALREATEANPNPLLSTDAHSVQEIALKPDSQSSADSIIPAWTALATTSDEEDGLRSDSQATTPEPDDNASYKASERRPPRREIGPKSLKISRGAFNPTQPFAVVNSYPDDATTTPAKRSNTMPLLWLPPPEPSSVATTARTPIKRKPSQTSPDSSGRPLAKKKKYAPSGTTIRIPPMKPSPSTSTSSPIKMIYSKLMVGSGAPSTQSNDGATHDNGEGASAAVGDLGQPSPLVIPSLASGAPTRHVRPQKQPVITADALTVEGKLVDDALDTHVSTIRVLPQYAQSPKGDTYDVIRLHVALRAVQSGGVDKGKRRAHSPWTAPRWSKAGEFKERLDSFYGPGDINRGMGKGPTNTKRPSADEDVFITAPDQSDGVAVSGTALTEDEDDTDALLQGLRRGRLENPSPGKGTRTSQRLVSRNNSPEIV